MNIFSREKIWNIGTELLWIFLVVVLGIEFCRQDLNQVENLSILLEMVPTVDGIQLLLMLLFLVAGVFIAFLQELSYKGAQWLKAAAPAGCMAGLLLLAVYQLNYSYSDALPDTLLLWSGRIALLLGYLLTVLPTFLKQWKNKDFPFIYKIAKVILLLILLVCIFPELSLCGSFLPLGICLIYEIYYIYRKEKENFEADRLSGLQQMIKKKAGKETELSIDLTENEGFGEGLLESLRKHAAAEESANRESEGKPGTVENGEKSAAGGEETVTEADSTKNAEAFGAESIGNPEDKKSIAKRQTEEAKAKKSESLDSFLQLPEELGRMYLYDRESGQMFRYDAKNRRLTLLGTGKTPGFDVLVPKDDRAAFQRFLEGKGNRQICTWLWDEETASFQETVIRATEFDKDPRLDLLLCMDSSTAGRRYERKLEEEQRTENELKQQLELARDEQRRVFQSTRELLNDIIQKKSNESKLHLNRVSQYSEILLETYSRRHPEAQLDPQTIVKIGEAALFHDIGKIEVPDDILNKHERLTAEEQEEMQRHTVYGAQLINKMPFVDGYEDIMKYALELALHHHERYDGSGYPEGLKGEKIPWFVQLVSLADAYEALTSDRSYRNGRSHAEACQMILNGECGAFSEEMMKTFTEAMPALQDAHYQFETVV